MYVYNYRVIKLAKTKAQDLSVIVSALALVAITPINTDISPSHMLIMAGGLSLALLAPYFYLRSKPGRQIVFKYNFQSLINREKIAFVLFGVALSYFIFPIYFSSTGSYQNWPNTKTAGETILLFIGTNALGLWDELFFINTILTIFRRHAKFWIANICQALFFTIFLYELGFTGWAPLIIYPFALIQGYMFMKYKSLGLVIVTHLSIDFILFLAILNAHGNLPFKFFISG